MHASEIIIVPDKYFIEREHYSTFTINDTFVQNIIIAPNHDEHFLSSELFEFQLYCHQNKIKITSFSRPNYFPFLSIFSDEIILSYNHKDPGWYDTFFSSNEIDFEPVKKLEEFVDLDGPEKTGSGFRNYKQVNNFEFSSFEIVESMWSRKVYIRESTYFLFQKYVKNLPRNIIVCEIKQPGGSSDTMWLSRKINELPNVVGTDYMFQRMLLNKTKYTNYLGFQILCSLLLGWTYVCVGGSANLFSLLPIRSIILSDNYMSLKSAEIFRIIAQKQYGEFGTTYPIIAHSKNSKDIIPKINIKELYEASQFLSQLPPPPINYYKRPGKIILF